MFFMYWELNAETYLWLWLSENKIELLSSIALPENFADKPQMFSPLSEAPGYTIFNAFL